jgi:hypothetical protein
VLRGAVGRLRRFDPGLGQLRLAALTMAATLASYASALALDHAEGLGLSVVVLAVVLSLTLSRNYHARGPREWLTGLAVLSLLAPAASEVGSLLITHPDAGDALFAVAVSGSIWLRRFGPGFARAGTLISLPFVALLVAPAVPGAGHRHLLWAAVIGAIAYFWVSVTRTLGERTRFVAPAPRRPHPTSTRSTSTAGQARRLAASSRMALQMAVALGLAFVAGRALFGVHWSWLVMTAFIVSSGNRGRADVVYKSGLRIAGAAAGTVVATLLAGQLAPGDATTVVVIFVVLGLASWLRPFSYAYWAAGITSVLALLYGYFGESGTHVLPARLEGIVVGAAIAIVVSWLLVPVRTTDVLRRRLAELLSSLSELLAALAPDQAELAAGRPQLAADEADLAAGAQRFEHALAALEEIAKPLHAHRFLARRLGQGVHVADAIDAARRCRAPVASLVECAIADPQALAAPAVARRRSRVAAQVGAARRALAGRHEDEHSPKRGGAAGGQPPAQSAPELALAELDAAVSNLAGSYRSRAATA